MSDDPFFHILVQLDIVNDDDWRAQIAFVVYCERWRSMAA